MAAKGYPGSYPKGEVISGLEQADTTIGSDGNAGSCKVFHAGTAFKSGDDADSPIVTNGGRVLCVVGQADTIQQARNTAYNGCQKIAWGNVYYRGDIGHRAM